jgi:hypothetical protein
MGIKTNTLLLVLGIIPGCRNAETKPHILKNDSLKRSGLDSISAGNFALENEQHYLARKTKLCKELGLYDLQTESVSFELRMWNFPSMWDPSILYVLKKKDSIWTLFHSQYYIFRSTDPMKYSGGPVVDSAVMESVRPQKISWTEYINNLRLDSLWNMKTESAIQGKTFEVVDGSRSLLEIRAANTYKYLFYTVPTAFIEKDDNHKRFVEFKKRMVEPIIYRGMRNP